MKKSLWRGQMWLLWGSVLLLLLGGCNREGEKKTASGPPPPPVVVAPVVQQNVTIYREHAARLEARETVEIRARVEGFLEKVLFQEGSQVKAGQLLFIIDQRPYKAALQDARGQLAQAQAAFGKAQKDVERLRPLVAAEAAPRQDLDRAESDAEFSTASIEKAKAAIAKAALDLKFTEIRSPIQGIVGREEVTVGNLVARDRTLLTTISSWEPMRAVFAISEGDYLQMAQLFPGIRSQAESGREAIFELLLADGSRYPFNGRLSFVDRALDLTTGTLRVFVNFPNPGNILKPGLFGRIRFPVEERAGALLVPQRAVQRLQDVETVLVVGPENRVALRPVTLGERVGDAFIVQAGLQAGESVVVEGLQNAMPGQMVNPVPPTGRPMQQGG